MTKLITVLKMLQVVRDVKVTILKFIAQISMTNFLWHFKKDFWDHGYLFAFGQLGKFSV